MALSVTHTFVSAIPDDADASLVRPSNWNDVHALSGVLPVANGGTGITSFGAGIDTFLGTPSSANLAAAVTDETGTGALVFANTPTFVTPILGTPTSGNLANCTGYPVGSISGTVPATAGGTGLTSYAVGDIIYAATTTTLAKLADVATGNALISGGVNTAPSWGKIALATAVSGNLPVGNLNSGTNADNTHFWRGDGTWAIPASGGTPGGASLTLQYNNASAFAGMSGTSWDDTNRSLTMTGATVTTSNPVLNMTQTWNAAVKFTALKLNVTNSGGGLATSQMIDMQLGGSTVFEVDLNGRVAFGAAFSRDRFSVSGSTGLGVAPTAVLYQSFLGMNSTYPIEWTSGSDASSGADTFIKRGGAAATLQFGAGDAAVAVAQTTQVQSVVAGTSGVAGALWTFQGSRSTGTAAGGDIAFFLSPNPGIAAATTQNTAVEHHRLLAAGNFKFTNAANFSANGSVATVLGSLGPTGASTTVTKWLTFVDNGGTTRYVPCF